MRQLAVDGNGNYKKTVNNIILALQNDPLLKGRIVKDEFAGRGTDLRRGAVEQGDGETVVDRYGHFRILLVYGDILCITARNNMTDALAIVGEQNKINEVKQYLQSLTWDGVKRVDTLLSVYLGAEDTLYTRAVMRKSLCAAVARAIVGGVKYDNMPIITGPQGIGKSTFLAILGKAWFSDSLTSFEGKDAAELIQGTWINEVGELTAFTKQETSAIKQFLSKCYDIYRAPMADRQRNTQGVVCSSGPATTMSF